MSAVAGDAGEQTLVSVCTDAVEPARYPSRRQRRSNSLRRPRFRVPTSAEVNPPPCKGSVTELVTHDSLIYCDPYATPTAHQSNNFTATVLTIFS